MAIDNGPCRVCRTIGAIGTDRHHPHLGQAGNLQSGGGGEFLRPPACALSSDSHGGFPTGHHTARSLSLIAHPHNILGQDTEPVSYTHLTLPTSDLV